jgi:hypothetical protein
LEPQAENEVSLMYVATVMSLRMEKPANFFHRLIRDNEPAMEGLMSHICGGNDSTWVKKYGEDLRTQISDLSGCSHVSLPTKKTQVFRILRDRHQKLVQGAFCINHWVSPLEEDSAPRMGGNTAPEKEDFRLQQMIVYWQYQDVSNQETVRKKGKKEKEKREREKNPIPGSLARKDNQAEHDLSKALETISELKRPPNTPFYNSDKRDTTEKSGRVHERRGPLFRSNLIVVFERSRQRYDQIRPNKSIILHELLQSLPTEYPPPIGDTEKSYPDTETHPELFKEGPSGLKAIELVKTVTENVCDKLTEHLSKNVHSYRNCQAQLAEKVYQNPGDEKLPNKLWAFSRAFQNAGKVVKSLEALVSDLEDEFQRQLGRELFSEPFLAKFQQNLRQMKVDIKDDLQRPIAEITDYVYKSVSIRDTRNSYELNTSLWRLSWVTFVFLPLTFVAGVFGMNVDTFEHNPSIKWYV